MQDYIKDYILELRRTNQQLEKFVVRKKELTDKIIEVMGHTHKGQKTYEYNAWKIEIKTPCIYSLNKKLYESGDVNLPSSFNPIQEYKSYAIDKRLCDKYIVEAPPEVRKVLVELIDMMPGKASVVVKERAK